LTEALPLALLEAMAKARPVIATRVGGVPEIVEHQVNGWLIEPGVCSGTGASYQLSPAASASSPAAWTARAKNRFDQVQRPADGPKNRRVIPKPIALQIVTAPNCY